MSEKSTDLLRKQSILTSALNYVLFTLATGHHEDIEVEGAAHKGDNYLFNRSMNYFDLAIDENALWVMYHYEKEDFLSIAKGNNLLFLNLSYAYLKSSGRCSPAELQIIDRRSALHIEIGFVIVLSMAQFTYVADFFYALFNGEKECKGKPVHNCLQQCNCNADETGNNLVRLASVAMSGRGKGGKGLGKGGAKRHRKVLRDNI
uniref:Histone H4 n=1 Tax=Heterorhabditis bacteriophora TaxID=37862 RepID=A0A1I7W6H7_HETBA